MTTITARVSVEEKAELVRRYGSVTKAVRSLFAADESLAHRQKVYVICGSYAEFRAWQEEQVALRARGEVHLRPGNAVYVDRPDKLRGLSLHSKQLVRYGAWTSVMDAEMSSYVALALMKGGRR